MDYVVISPDYLYHMAGMIRSNIGTVFSVSLHLFIAVLYIYVILQIIKSFVQ